MLSTYLLVFNEGEIFCGMTDKYVFSKKPEETIINKP